MHKATDRLFFSLWLRAPRTIGAVLPSGPALGRAMAAEIDPARPGRVIELGGGTGVLTRALLARGIAPERLLVLERTPELADHLRRELPGVEVVCDDAAQVGRIVRARGVEQVAAVVSGLPLLAMPTRVQLRIIAGAFSLLDAAAPFIQFTYGPMTPIAARILNRLGISGRPVRYVVLNAPPAMVWRYHRTPSTPPLGDG